MSVSKKVLVAAMFVAAAALTGCGSNSITAPDEQSALSATTNTMSIDRSLQMPPVDIAVRPTVGFRETLHPTAEGDSTIIINDATPPPPPPPPSTPPPPDVRQPNPHKTVKITLSELKEMFATSRR